MEINERDSSRTRAVCLAVHQRIEQRVREWRCCVCFSLSDTDDAINILRLGREALTHPGDRKVAGA